MFQGTSEPDHHDVSRRGKREGKTPQVFLKGRHPQFVLHSQFYFASVFCDVKRNFNPTLNQR